MTQILHKKQKCYRVSHETSGTQEGQNWYTRGTKLVHKRDKTGTQLGHKCDTKLDGF